MGAREKVVCPGVGSSSGLGAWGLGGVLADGTVYPDGGLDASLFGCFLGRGAGASALFLFAGCDASGDYLLDADGSVPQELWDAKGVPFEGGFGDPGGGNFVLSLLDVGERVAGAWELWGVCYGSARQGPQWRSLLAVSFGA